MNPFRLLGSWIGLVLGLLVGFFVFSAVDVLCEFGSCKVTVWILPLIPVIVGFLVGWGIHSILSRK